VANELRIFPVVTLDGELSPYVSPLMKHLRASAFKGELVATEYEFVRAENHAGNRMMRVCRP
jgi:hypothetical protein